MAEISSGPNRSLWHADSGRCSSCKSHRIKNNVLGQKEYDICMRGRDCPTCEIYEDRLVPSERQGS